MQLVLSLFPGADLFGMAFEEKGFCVVRGPDKLMGGDITKFHCPKDRFDGIIGGPPCQYFSMALREKSLSEGNLIPEFERIIIEANPKWWVMENVRHAPSPKGTNWSMLLDSKMFGSLQTRKRKFSSNIILDIIPVHINEQSGHCPAVMATEYKYHGISKDRRRAGRFFNKKLSIEEVNVLMGLPRDYSTPSLTTIAQYAVRGNGVPLEMGRAIADAVIRATKI